MSGAPQTAEPSGAPVIAAVRKRQVRAAEYRRLALAADGLAQASLLSHVREKHEEAAARWTALAILDERPSQQRHAQMRSPRRAPPALSLPQLDEDAPA